MASSVKVKSYYNNTMEMFQKLNTVLYFCGLIDFWVEKVKLPEKIMKIFNFLSIFIEIIMFSFMLFEVGAFITQKNLSPKQEADWLMFSLTHLIMYIYVKNLIYYKQNVRDVLYQLAIVLKKVHNDLDVEQQMLSKLKFYLMAYAMSCGLAILFYGANAFMQYIRTEAPFITVITVWPDVEDKSNIAHIARVLLYFVWWIYFCRVSGSSILLLSMFICLRFQYKNLTRYFYKMNCIFDSSKQHSELEKIYDSALKIGIKLHVDTLWCTHEFQKIYSIIFSAQLFMTLADLVSIITQMMTFERSVVNFATMGFLISGVMVSTGFIVWNAGDVTIEASHLPVAMFASGWQNCSSGSSARTRKLLVLAIKQAQKPVVFKAFGCVEMSYQTYLSIVKSSYSVFSVLF